MARFFAIGTLVIMGVIAADVLAHPKGTQAAGSALAGVLKPTYNALLGYKV